MTSVEAEPDENALMLSFDGQRRRARGGGLRLSGWIDVKFATLPFAKGNLTGKRNAKGFRNLKDWTASSRELSSLVEEITKRNKTEVRNIFVTEGWGWEMF
ncbi:MAG: hypothetical protein ACEY26_00715 [Candidatus Hodgkinia cicadicola]